MLSRLNSIALHGIDALPCEVEVDVSKRGFIGPTIVGLPDAAVKESVHRIKAALQNCGYQFPRGNCTISLAPAHMKKEGPAFDLPIALGLIFADAQEQASTLSRYIMVGELALDGRVRPVRGALSAALIAKQRQYAGVILPKANAAEAGVVEDIQVIGVNSLTDAVGFLTDQLEIEPTVIDPRKILAQNATTKSDYADVCGQQTAKRALTIAAAGGHNVLLIGPPGSGKTMISKRLPTILPPLSVEESLETTRIYSAAGQLSAGSSLLSLRPFRAPHHTASGPALVGGGTIPQAGEVSLANHGVLFLDEFPEFQRSILEMLRQPLEDGVVEIARSHSSVRFPAKFILIAAMNPCPCGYHGATHKACRCNPQQIEKYMGKISGPLLDRIDIHLHVPSISYDELRRRQSGLSSAAMLKHVLRARALQQQRFGQLNMTNNRMTPSDLHVYCKLGSQSESILRSAVTQLGLSARAHDKVLRTARTIADLAESSSIAPEHITEAVHYRQLDRSH